MNYPSTSTERVKTFTPSNVRALDAGDFRKSLIETKGFDPEIIIALSRRSIFSPLFHELVLRNFRTEDTPVDNLGRIIDTILPSRSTIPYSASYSQNQRIDMSLANAGMNRGKIRFGQGAATYFDVREEIVPEQIRSVPIAIVGYGAAGIMVRHALRRIGFSNTHAFEKSKTLGIWGNKNVFNLSRNNPFEMNFFGKSIEPAPGSGLEIRNFLENMTGGVSDGNITKIEPGKLSQKIFFDKKGSEEFPIVINTSGMGKPKPVSDPDRMVTATGAGHAGARWQRELDPEEVKGKRIILIGLGNSTAEMLRQLHAIEDQGTDVHYRIITHYPEDSIMNPSEYVLENGKQYRVFRDISKPNLVDYQGDITRSRYDYFRALHGGRIITDVRRWEIAKPGTMTVSGKEERFIGAIPYDKIMTLIGYCQTPENVKELGCCYDEKNRCAVFDYDGESVATPGSPDPEKRLNKGYFGFGSILENPWNQNATVIPGMIHRIGDLLFGIIMRACEVRKNELLHS